MVHTRRDFGRLALAALPAARLLSAEPNSVFNGVAIGINAPISFRGLPGTADDIITNMTTLGLSVCELRLQPIEGFIRGTGANPLPNAPRRGRGQSLTPEQEAEMQAANEELDKWRLGLPSDVFTSFRKKYEDAGISIPILKIDSINTMSDDIVDYCFEVAKLVGAKALSAEIPVSTTKRIGQFAEKHKMLVGYHGHTNTADPEAFATPESWETAMSYSAYNGVNLDIGHFLAANSLSPLPYLEKWHERVTHLHLKDRKTDMGPNMIWGEGDTPIVECLQMIRDEKWDIPGIIEWEYRAPEGSDVMTELARCIEYCRKALV